MARRYQRDVAGLPAQGARSQAYAIAGALVVTSADTFRLLHRVTGSPARQVIGKLTDKQRHRNVAAGRTRAALAACLALSTRLLIVERQYAARDLPEIGLPTQFEFGVTVLEGAGRPVWSAMVRATAASSTELSAALADWQRRPQDAVAKEIAANLDRLMGHLGVLAELLNATEPAE